MSEPAPKTAIGYSIIANLGDDRQITIQHFIGDDEDDAVVNQTMDRIMSFIDRQKAIRKIPELQAEKRQVEGQIAQSSRDVEMLDAEYKAAEVARDQMILDLKGREKDAFDTGYKAHVESGRRGNYKPQGQTAAIIQGVKSDVGKLVEEAIKQANERAQALQNLEANINMRRVRVAQIDEEIAELQAKVT